MNDIKDGSSYVWNDIIDAMEEYRNKTYQPFITTNSHHTSTGNPVKNLLTLESQWRDATWSTAATATSVQQQVTNSNASEHAVSQPIMLPRRRGSFPGSDAPSMLSPRLSDTGVKMVEYVLSNSPTSKDIESRMSRLTVSGSTDSEKKSILENENAKLSHKDDHHSHHASHHHSHRGDHSATSTGSQNLPNGIIHNGLDDDGTGKVFNRTPGSHQASGGDEDNIKSMMMDASGHGFDPNFDTHIGIDPLQFSDYSQILPSTIDSPGMLEYNTQMYQQRAIGQSQHQQSAQAVAAAMNQQQPYSQVAAAAQQQNQGLPHPYTSQGIAPQSGAAGNPFPQNPYYQDPFGAQTGHLIPAGPPPPTILPPYYGLASWNMYHGMIQGGQNQHFAAAPPPHVQQQQTQQQNASQQQQQHQQIIAQTNGQRPLTPQGTSDPNNANSQYSMLPAQGYYDQNGSLLMGNSAAVTSTNMRAVNPAAAAAMRGMNPGTMRIIPPMIMNPNQNGNNMRLMPGSGQNGQAVPPSILSSNASNVNNNALYTSGSTASALGYANSAVSSSTLMNGNIGYNPISSAQGGFSNGVLGPIGGSSTISNGSPRRDSFENRRPENSISGGGIFSNNHIDGQFTRHFNNKNGQFYGPMNNQIPASPGPIGMIPQNQNITPPPTMNGTNGMNPSAFNAPRVMPTGAGSDGKYMLLNVPINGNILPQNFQNRVLTRNSSIDKPAGRSRFLEEFRNNRYPNLTLRELVDHIVEFSQDQHGSRFIQQKLERATTFEKQLVFNEILPSAYNLMTDVFGNYVIQKFFEFGTPEQKQSLAMKVKGHVLQLALQMYGCRVIQKALESIPPEQQKEIVKELDGHVLKCVKDQNGNHVVQKCIECVDPKALQFIIKDFQGQVYSLSTHPYGCRVIQRILEHCTSDQTTPILEELHSHTEQLVQDQYGNYVIQHVLEHGRPEDKSKIINSVRGKMLSLSQHKFASNVIEKCVTHASRAERALLIEEVCSYQENGTSNDLYRMMKDQYANYVVQKMIEVAEPVQKKLLIQRIRPLLHVLRKYTYGKHILAKLDKHLVGKGGDLAATVQQQQQQQQQSQQQSQQNNNTANGSI